MLKCIIIEDPIKFLHLNVGVMVHSKTRVNKRFLWLQPDSKYENKFLTVTRPYKKQYWVFTAVPLMDNMI